MAQFNAQQPNNKRFIWFSMRYYTLLHNVMLDECVLLSNHHKMLCFWLPTIPIQSGGGCVACNPWWKRSNIFPLILLFIFLCSQSIFSGWFEWLFQLYWYIQIIWMNQCAFSSYVNEIACIPTWSIQSLISFMDGIQYKHIRSVCGSK